MGLATIIDHPLFAGRWVPVACVGLLPALFGGQAPPAHPSLACACAGLGAMVCLVFPASGAAASAWTEWGPVAQLVRAHA